MHNFATMIVNNNAHVHCTLINLCTFSQVALANGKLHHWKTETDKCRRECAELAFFSNEKVMRILRILQSTRPSSVDIVKEIAFLYKSDQETNRQLTLAVQVGETACCR